MTQKNSLKSSKLELSKSAKTEDSGEESNEVIDETAINEDSSEESNELTNEIAENNDVNEDSSEESNELTNEIAENNDVNEDSSEDLGDEIEKLFNLKSSLRNVALISLSLLGLLFFVEPQEETEQISEEETREISTETREISTETREISTETREITESTPPEIFLGTLVRSVQVASLAPSCHGRTSSQPAVELTFSESVNATFEVTSQGPLHQWSVITCQEGECSCGSALRSPIAVHHRNFQPGNAEIYVGCAGNCETEYQLSIYPGPPRNSPTLQLGSTYPIIQDGEPATETDFGSFGGVLLAENTAPAILNGVIDSSRDASAIGYSCRGKIGELPNHIVDLEAESTLTFRIRSDYDTTLAIIGPEDWWCNDDTEGLNPLIQRSFSAGSYHIFVGAIGSPDLRPAYTLTVSR